jgi:hypothetical protein
MAGFIDDSKGNSEQFPGFHLMNKQAGVFYLRGAIFCCLSVGQVGLC